MSPRFLIARHGETVFNAQARLQGEAVHTPLTRAGFAQADAIGEALKAQFGARPALELWASATGRTLQTLAIVAEHLELDWHQARIDGRLREINKGAWGGRTYAEIIAEVGPIYDEKSLLFTRRAPDGEWYDGVAARLLSWLREHGQAGADKLVITHGITSRVLRGLLTGAPVHPKYGAPAAEALPQGSLVLIDDGSETVLHRGSGAAPA